MTKLENRKLRHKVYRKPTHTTLFTLELKSLSKPNGGMIRTFADLTNVIRE